MSSTDAPAEPSKPENPTEWDSELAKNLLKQWAWYLSSTQVQQASAASYQDQLQVLQAAGVSMAFASKTLKQLAQLGKACSKKNNRNKIKELKKIQEQWQEWGKHQEGPPDVSGGTSLCQAGPCTCALPDW